MRLVLLGGPPGVGKSATARDVLTHHTAERGAPLLQWVDVDALWLHQPWRVDERMRALVDANLRAVLSNAAAAGVAVVLVTWTFHCEELRDVVRRAAPAGTEVQTIQLVAEEEAWRRRFAADPARTDVDAFYAQRYAAAQAMSADVVVDTSDVGLDEVAAAVAAVTLAR